MSRGLPPAWWLLCLLPAWLRVVVDLLDGRTRPASWALAAAPGLVLLGVVGLARARRTPLAREVDHELRLLAPGLLETMGGLCALQALGLDREQVLASLTPDLPAVLKLRAGLGSFAAPLAGFGLFAIAAHSFGGEFSAGTTASWLMTPRPRWVLTARKLLLLAFALGVATAQVLVLPLGLGELAEGPGGLAVGSMLVLPLALLAFALGPAGTLVTRSVSGALVAAVLGVLVVAWSAHLFGELAAWVAVATLAPLGLGTTAWLASRLDPLGGAAPETGRWAARVSRLVPGPLLRKELVLQRSTFFIGAVLALLWAALAVVRAAGLRFEGVEDLGWGPLVPLSVLCTLAAGGVTFSQEPALGTADWMATTLSRPRQWRLKVGVSLAAAVLGGVLLPAALVALSPGWGTVLAELASSRAGGGASPGALVGLWVAGALVAWAVGVFASTLAQRDLAAALGAAFGLTAAVLPVLVLVTASGAGAAWAGCVEVGSSRALEALAHVLGPAQLLPVVVGALFSAHAVWRHGRSVWTAAAVGAVVLVAVAALSAARVQAHRAARAPVCGAVDDLASSACMVGASGPGPLRGGG